MADGCTSSTSARRARKRKTQSQNQKFNTQPNKLAADVERIEPI